MTRKPEYRIYRTPLRKISFVVSRASLRESGALIAASNPICQALTIVTGTHDSKLFPIFSKLSAPRKKKTCITGKICDIANHRNLKAIARIAREEFASAIRIMRKLIRGRIKSRT
jgi:hypothetical protein